MKNRFRAAALAAVALATAFTTACSSDPDTQTCQQWSEDYGLTDQAVIVACQTGDNATGDMTEDEYQDRLDQSLNDVKSIIDSTGGL